MIRLLFISILLPVISIISCNSNKDTHAGHNDGAVQDIYTCPMHPEVTSDKPGTCTKCGMSLTLSPKEKMKMEVMKKYS